MSKKETLTEKIERNRRIEMKMKQEAYQLGFNEAEKRLIQDFLYKIRHIPLFWAIFSQELKEVYENIDKIRDYYQKKLKGELS
nr:MAG: hypothetical protein [uncultured archaeon]